MYSKGKNFFRSVKALIIKKAISVCFKIVRILQLKNGIFHKVLIQGQSHRIALFKMVTMTLFLDWAKNSK